MNHTKGEWRIRETDSTIFIETNEVLIARLYAETDKKLVADLEKWTNGKEAKPNARLISAAPNMFEVLKELKPWIERYIGNDPIKDKALEAIQKAKGKEE